MKHLITLNSFLKESYDLPGGKDLYHQIKWFMDKADGGIEDFFISFSDSESLQLELHDYGNHLTPKALYAYPLYNPDKRLSYIQNGDIHKSFRFFTDRKYIHIFNLKSMDILLTQKMTIDQRIELEQQVFEILVADYNQDRSHAAEYYLNNDSADDNYTEEEQESEDMAFEIFYKKLFLYFYGNIQNPTKTEREDVNNEIPAVIEKLGYSGLLTYTNRIIDNMIENQLALFDLSQISAKTSIPNPFH